MKLKPKPMPKPKLKLLIALALTMMYYQQLSLKRMDTEMIMEAHALTGMPRNHGVKMHKMNGVNLHMNGAMLTLFAKAH